MTTSASDDLYDLLVDTLSYTDVFVGVEPSKVGNTITIYDTPGDNPGMYQDITRPVLDRPNVQIRVRRRNYADAVTVIQAIIKSLQTTAPYYTSAPSGEDVWYIMRYQQISSWINIGHDEEKRTRLTVNFRVHRKHPVT